MSYQIKSNSESGKWGEVEFNEYSFHFGINDRLDVPNPLELLLSSFSACCL